jgi:hypothetical protein
VTTSRGRCPPPPSDDIRAELATAQIHFNPRSCVRVFWNGCDPLAFSRGIGTRFDPLPKPWETTKVLYGGTSLETAIAEVLCRWHGDLKLGARIILSERDQLAPRRVARFDSKRQLTVIDATGLGRAAIEDVISRVIRQPKHTAIWSAAPTPIADDIFQCGADEYSLTQQWGAWFRSQCPDADGIQWVSRQFNVGSCLALFEDRCGGQLQLTELPVPLYAAGSEERAVVDRMVGLLKWGIH